MNLIEGTRSYQWLRRVFTAQYGDVRPTHLVTAPGRVNLIGEHIDYNLLPVLPMAIERRVHIILRARNDAAVRIASTEPGFGAREFGVGSEIEPFRSGDWGNYVKAAVQGIAQRAPVRRGFEAIVHSDIPVAAGLSSSSALVVATGLGVAVANGIDMPRLTLAELLARAERYVGTQGGGMDQAAALCAEPGAALLIEFDPLRVRAQPVPEHWQCVVASSLVRADKSGRARQIYNRRTEECREALEHVLRAVPRSPEEHSYRGLRVLYGTEELLELRATIPNENLRRRFRHVITEAQRVEDAVAALDGEDLTGFGRLLDAAHASLRDDYEVSTAALDELTVIARQAGAAGARLTGAGLGGCIVAVCSVESAASVLAALREQFYAPRGMDAAEHRAFLVQPVGGAQVWALE